MAPSPQIPPVPPVPGMGVPGTDVTFQVPAPLSRQDIQAIRAARSELSSQLQSAQRRREDLSEAMKTAEGADRAGLEQRLILLDNRILQLETDIAETGRALTSAGAMSGSTIQEQGLNIGGANLSNGQVTGLLALLIIFVLAPLAIGFARLVWKRAMRPPKAVESTESRQRFERLEQAVDTIAIEIERVSEGQRYLTRLLTESPVAMPLAAGQRAAEPVAAHKSDAALGRDEG